MKNQFPTLVVYDKFLNEKMYLEPDIYISSDGRLVIVYESEPKDYTNFDGDIEDNLELQ